MRWTTREKEIKANAKNRKGKHTLKEKQKKKKWKKDKIIYPQYLLLRD
jgi:hypothetical protein